ncbi:MAG TPA: hypothetical protein VLA85_22645 [Verrucomicrobiae bacterium]|nr:hypothetical protein [Verrucomicrobiae bacterium]
MRQRRFGIAFLAAALLAVLPSGLRADQPSGNTNSSDNTPWNRRLDDARVDEIRLQTDRYDTVTEVVVITPDCAFRSDTRNINRRNVNRIGFTQDIPLIGGFFENTPRAGRLDGSNQIGLAFLDGNVLYIDTRSAAGSAKADSTLLTGLAKGPTGAASASFAVAGAGSPENVSVVNRDFQYVIQTGGFTAVAPAGYRCGPNAMAALPSLAPLFERPEGTAHFLNGQLIALVRPSIIAN